MKYLIAIYLPIVNINLNYFVKEIFNSKMCKKNIFLYHRQINQYEFLKRIYGKVTEYGQCPNTDTLCISETINSTKNVNE